MLRDRCPERAVGLSHIRDLQRRPDGRCAYCGAGMDDGPLPGRSIPMTSITDMPHAGICREGRHPSILCFRWGSASAPEFICWAHLIRLVRDVTK